MKLRTLKLPRMANMAFQPRLGTTVLLNTTPMTAEKPKPVKKSAFTRTPSLHGEKESKGQLVQDSTLLTRERGTGCLLK